MANRFQSKKSIENFLVFFLFILSFFQTINAQYSISRVTTEKGIPGAMQKGFGTVNPYNGKLNFSLPLINVDSGRGKVGFQAPLVIKNDWSVKFTGSTWGCVNQPNCTPYMTNILLLNNEEGPKPGFSPGVLSAIKSGKFNWQQINVINSVTSPFPYGIAGSQIFQPVSGNGGIAYVSGIEDSLTKLVFKLMTDQQLLYLMILQRDNQKVWNVIPEIPIIHWDLIAEKFSNHKTVVILLLFLMLIFWIMTVTLKPLAYAQEAIPFTLSQLDIYIFRTE